MPASSFRLPVFFLLFLFAALRVSAQQDYLLTINGKTQEVGLNQEFTALINGQPATFKLASKDTLTYRDAFYSFKHPKELKPTTLKIEEGIEQLTLLTGDGTGFIIQKYTSMNPSGLTDMMLQEVTKESINYGFKMKTKDSEKKLKNGQKLNVRKATLTYKGQTNVYEIATYGRKDEGLIILTMVMDDSAAKSANSFIDLLWNSFEIK